MMPVLGELLPHGIGPQDRFQIVRQLGQGAHGVVYEALDRVQRSHVALKTLRSTDANSILRLKREFRELVSLHHPNLVELGELFDDDGRWFFSMELLSGVDFLSHVRRLDQDVTVTASRGVDSDELRLRAALVQLGRGLSALHAAGKLHRDIKPSNIRVEPDGRLVLLDFGLVAPLAGAADPELRQLVGTVAYMAPEQAALGPLGAASDCYAVGILLYEALTGETPFRGSLLEVLAAKRERCVRIAPERASRLPADLVALCHDLCQLDPALRPGAAELAARASGHEQPGARVRRVASVACAGRETELSTLSLALDRARRGEPALVRVYGEPGIGKSTLLSAWAAQLASASPASVVLRGGCHERERVAYNALDAVIDALGEQLACLPREELGALVPRRAAALAQVFPVLGQLCSVQQGLAGGPQLPRDPITLRSHAYGALRELLGRLAARGPVVLLLDDLQWADAESLALLDAITQPPEAPALLIVLTCWPLERCPDWLQRVLGSLPAARDLTLSVLPDGAARELAAHVIAREAGAAEPASLEHIAAVSGGHPLFVELLARAAARGAASHPSLTSALAAELLRYAPDVQALLQLLSVAGAPLSAAVLRQASGLAPESFGRALAELREVGLLALHHEPATRIAIYHTPIRDAVRVRLDAAATRAQHLALARALSQEPTRDHEALAVHWERAACLPAAAACYAQAAGEAERARAFMHAAELWKSALACAPAHPQRHAWQLSRASALANAGRSAEAAEAFVAAADLASPEARQEALRAAARQFLCAGDTEHGLAIARQLLACVDQSLPRGPRAALASMLWQRARLALGGLDALEQPAASCDPRQLLACDLLSEIAAPLSMLDLARSCDLSTRAVRLALELGDPVRMARALANEALYGRTGSVGSELRALGILARAQNLAQRSGDPRLIGVVKLATASRHVFSGEPLLALAEADAALPLFEEHCHDVAWEIGSAHALGLTALVALGRFDELEQRYQAAVEAAQQRGNVPSFVTLVASNRCVVDLVADRPEQGRASLDEVTRAWPAERELQHLCALFGQVLIELYEGGDAAHRRLERAWPHVTRQLSFANRRFAILLYTARGLAALSALAADGCDPRRGSRLVGACAAWLGRERAPDARASAQMLLAQLATWQGDRPRALACYATAEALWDSVGMYVAHVARERMAELETGPAYAARREQARAWAHAQRIQRSDRFFRTCAPIDASMLGCGKGRRPDHLCR